ncbi:MAG: hypothetical protein WCR51_04650 [Planctomycetia bacterium]
MATKNTLSPADLAARLSSIASSHGGTSSMRDDLTVTGKLTAIKAKWFLGGRKVTSTFTCTLDPAKHEAHFLEKFRESVEQVVKDAGWGFVFEVA